MEPPKVSDPTSDEGDSEHSRQGPGLLLGSVISVATVSAFLAITGRMGIDPTLFPGWPFLQEVIGEFGARFLFALFVGVSTAAGFRRRRARLLALVLEGAVALGALAVLAYLQAHPPQIDFRPILLAGAVALLLVVALLSLGALLVRAFNRAWERGDIVDTRYVMDPNPDGEDQLIGPYIDGEALSETLKELYGDFPGNEEP